MTNSFDKAAPFYDESFTHSQIGKCQRQHVYNHLSKLLVTFKPETILEINCGTGEDALWLAKQDFKVTATDISASMIETAKKKTIPSNLNFKQADINELTTDFHNQKFDMIFSNFGGLNCLTENELSLFLKNASELLNENGTAALVIMPKNALWEQLYFFAKGQFNNVFRRKKDNVIADVNGEKVPTYYYNPAQVKSFARNFFTFKQVNPVGLFLPPSYLETFFKDKRPLMNFLDQIDNNLNNTDFLAKYADHYFIAFQKK